MTSTMAIMNLMNLCRCGGRDIHVSTLRKPFFRSQRVDGDWSPGVISGNGLVAFSHTNYALSLSVFLKDIARKRIVKQRFSFFSLFFLNPR